MVSLNTAAPSQPDGVPDSVVHDVAFMGVPGWEAGAAKAHVLGAGEARVLD